MEYICVRVKKPYKIWRHALRNEGTLLHKDVKLILAEGPVCSLYIAVALVKHAETAYTSLLICKVEVGNL